MKRMAVILSLTLAMGIALGVTGTRVLDAQYAQQEPVKRTVLQKVDLGDKEAVMFIAEIAPGASGGKHFHPGVELFYTIQGSWIYEAEGKPPITLKAGNFSNSPVPKLVHNATNASKTAPAKILGVLIAEKGQPLSTPVK